MTVAYFDKGPPQATHVFSPVRRGQRVAGEWPGGTRVLFEEYGQYERYVLAAAVKPHAARQSLDMFEGVRE